MKEVTKDLINNFNINELGYDFMGYEKQYKDMLSFHHLLIPNRYGGPYAYWNGVILYTIPHKYLHLIECKDYNTFCYITSEMQDMKVKGYLDTYNLKLIGELLSEFEYKFDGKLTSKGKKLIKPEFKNRLYK